jgi:hypothetical protein
MAVVGGCEKKEAAKEQAPDEKVLFQVIQDNVAAMNKKDVSAVMATIHPQAKYYDETRGDVEKVFTQGTYRITVSDLKVKDSNLGEAHVSFVQKTEKVDGDHSTLLNTVDVVDTLRADNEKWKIFDMIYPNPDQLKGSQANRPKPEAAAPSSATTPTSAAVAAPAPASTPAAAEAKPAAPDQKPPGEKPPQ